MKRILIVTPAAPGSLMGNRVTAERWAQFMQSWGYHVAIKTAYHDGYDVLIALHAQKSGHVIAEFAERQPKCPIILILTGTDLYRDIQSSKIAQRSLELAEQLVLLQPDGIRELHKRLHKKVTVIYQSSEAPRDPSPPSKRDFEICVTGHLRPVKDPFRAAIAARQLPPDSRIIISHLGAALTAEMETFAREETDRNPRYRWLGPQPAEQAFRQLARSRLVVHSSLLEGGAAVVSEAIVAGVPVISSRISGVIGMLGEDYEGYFETGNTTELSQLMVRCEQDHEFLETLRRQGAARAHLFRPARERAALQQLLSRVSP